MKVHHIAHTHNLIALVRYSMSGAAAVVVDISILYILVSAGTSNIIAVILSVAASSVVHYLISRYYVFRTYKRTFFIGYIYFVSIIGLSVVLNIGLYLIFVAALPIHFTILRIISIALVGILSFLLNAHYNFGTLTPK